MNLVILDQPAKKTQPFFQRNPLYVFYIPFRVVFIVIFFFTIIERLLNGSLWLFTHPDYYDKAWQWCRTIVGYQ